MPERHTAEYWAKQCSDQRERAERAEAENRILRGLVQTNPDWKCPHGEDIPSIGFCSSGFPGCLCADDRIAVYCEDEARIVSGLRASVQRLTTTAEELGEQLRKAEGERDQWLERVEPVRNVDEWAWGKMVRIGLRIRDEVYPRHIFTGRAGDTGPRLVATLGAILDEIAALSGKEE